MKRLAVPLIILAALFSLLLPGLPAAETGAQTVPASMGQTVYVPIYPAVSINDRGKDMSLSPSLIIRNTDGGQAISIDEIKLFDANGSLVKKILETPRILGPWATARYLTGRIKYEKDTGGACLIVKWTSPGRPVDEPIIESIMIGIQGNQGISFIRPGRVIEDLTASESD